MLGGLGIEVTMENGVASRRSSTPRWITPAGLFLLAHGERHGAAQGLAKRVDPMVAVREHAE